MNKNKTIFLVSNLISLTSLDLCRDDFGSLCGKHTASPWVNIIKRCQEGIPSERHWKHSASRKRILNLAKQPTGNAYLCQTLCNRFSKTNKFGWIYLRIFRFLSRRPVWLTWNRNKLHPTLLASRKTPGQVKLSQAADEGVGTKQTRSVPASVSSYP